MDDLQSELQAWLMRADANSTSAWMFLEWMALHGSSVSLTWGEDTDTWEAAWISRGKRFLGTGITALDAMKDLVRKARRENRE